jgi:Bacterial membrane protein YfhO
VNEPARNPDDNPRQWPWRPFLWTLGILCAAYLPLFLGKVLFFRDIAHWNYPARAFLRDALVRGELPGWNPYQGLGFPVFGDPLYGVFYPPNWLFVLVGPGWVANMLNWQCFAHMAWGAAGVCWLARRLGGSPKAIIIAGLAWALSGYTTAQWTSGLLLFADAWVPWVAAGHVALLDSFRAGGIAWRRGLVKAALPSVLAVLLGEVFLAMIGAGFGVLFAFVLHVVERRDDLTMSPTLSTAWPRVRVRWLAAAITAVALAFAAGAVVIVPARLLLGSTERAVPLVRAIAEACSLHPLRLVEFALPHSMGDAYGVFPAAPVVGEPRLDGLPLSYSMYMGASVLALVLAAFGRGRRLAWALGGLAVLALLLAFGKHTPVHAIFRRIVLPLAYMRYPEKYTVLVVAMVALLASLGARRILSDEPQPWRRTGILFLLIVACGFIAVYALPPAWVVFAVHGALLGGLGALGMLAVHALAARSSRLAPVMLVAVVVFDLSAAAWPLQGFGPRQIASGPPPAARLALERRSHPEAPPRLYRSNLIDATLRQWVPANSNAQGEFRLTQTLVTNTANAWGIATLPGYDAAIPALADRVWEAGLGVGQSALRLLGADYAILPVNDPAAKNDRPGLEPLADPLPGARMYRVPGALPRVFLARHAQVLADDEALRRLYEPDVVAGKSVWLAPSSTASVFSAPPGRAGTCALESYGDNRVVALCTAQERGLAVFVEQYDPGWRATVDGQPALLLRANLIMRALPIEAGTHRIVLEFHTPGLGAGATISVLSLLLLAMFWLAGGRKARAATIPTG